MITWKKVKHDRGDLQSSITVERWTSLVYVYGLTYPSAVVVIFSAEDVGGVKGKFMARRVHMFTDGRVGMIAVRVLFVSDP